MGHGFDWQALKGRQARTVDEASSHNPAEESKPAPFSGRLRVLPEALRLARSGAFKQYWQIAATPVTGP